MSENQVFGQAEGGELEASIENWKCEFRFRHYGNK